MKKEVVILLLIVVIVAIAGYLGSSYYKQSVQAPPSDGATLTEELVRSDSQSLGPAGAKVTLVEFYDPECEACASFHPVVKSFLKEFEGQLRIVVRYAPFHQNARLAATYTEAAGEQGKYWEMMEKLFEKQDEWGEKHGGGAQPAPTRSTSEMFDGYAKELGLNLEQLKASVQDPKHAAKIDRDMSDVRSLKVNRTPTIYVNGRVLAKLNQQDLRTLIREELTK